MEFKGTKGKWYTRGKYVTSEEEDICEVFLWDDPLEMDEGVTVQESVIIHKANAQLIAHTREMLEMLNHVKDYLESDQREKVEALINSATEVDNEKKSFRT